MDRNNHRMDTVLDAEYQPLDAQNLEPGRSRSMELLSALLLAVLGLTALAFPLAAGVSFAFFLTAALFLYGISQAAAFFLAAKELRSVWMLVSGVLNYLLSLLMFFNPIVSWFALTTVWGIYFLAAAVTLLFRHWSVRRGAHSRAS
ncbi:hypothetical protein B5E80_15950 [Flavonifractor sp. An135]|nr:DUF308 domain-containing protein [Flavonifractor sp. An135]OUQ22028.1 hypothetical protein B5E80_15950 [Flavonifractor sp. An135]